MTRLGNWMQTFTGRQFWPLDPRPEEVTIIDIAHALSNQCRFAGHCERFYSVAEHSVRVSWLAAEYVTEEFSRRAALAALLHDASEAYLVDLPRPVKRAVSGYDVAENRVQAIIMKRFDLLDEWETHEELIKVCDNRLLATEARDLMKTPPAPWVAMPPPIAERILPWDPDRARRVFLDTFDLCGGVG